MGGVNSKDKQSKQTNSISQPDASTFRSPMLNPSTLTQPQQSDHPTQQPTSLQPQQSQRYSRSETKQNKQLLAMQYQKSLEQRSSINSEQSSYRKQTLTEKRIDIDKLNKMLNDQIHDFTKEQKSNYPGEINDRVIASDVRGLKFTHKDSVLLGLWVGVSVSIIIVLIVIIVINDLSINDESTFSRDFPTWRGIAIFIFYVWMLGFDFSIFQKDSIRFRQVLKFNKSHHPTSLSLFKIAGLHTSIFVIMFLFYVLAITDIYHVPGFLAQYYASISWGLFGIFLFLPLPTLSHRGRFFVFNLFKQSMLSPFKGVTFPITWMTDQAVSMAIPLKDVQYTFCYYTQMDFKESYNVCQDSNRVQVVVIVAVSVCSMRILQCIRQGYDKGQYFMTPFFFNTLKYAFTLITAVLAFQYRLGDQRTQAAWLLFAILSTVYSYGWDILMDWDLLQKNDKHPFLREKLIFKPINLYYLIMVTNLILRWGWIMTISPKLASLLGDPNIVSLCAGMVQIFRRGIWNLIRIEKQHIHLPKPQQNTLSKSVQLQRKLARVQNTIHLQIKVLKFFKKFQKRRQKLRKQLMKLNQQNQNHEQFLQAYHTKLQKYNERFEEEQLKEIQGIMQETFKADSFLKKKIQSQTDKSKSASEGEKAILKRLSTLGQG